MKLFRIKLWSIAVWVFAGLSVNAQVSVDDTDPLQLAEQNIENYRKGPILLELVNPDGAPATAIQVHVEQTSHHFLFGSIVFELTAEGHFSSEREAIYKERFSRLFNLAIFPFYWDGYEHQAGHANWRNQEKLFGWCEETGIQAKGHPLAWTHPAGTPKWMYDLPVAYGTTLLKSRIVENVHGFKGKIDIWDVVNEATNTITWENALLERTLENDKRYGAYDTPIEVIADWVAPCYQWAHDSNPEATLILNDFGQIAWTELRDRFYQLVKTLQDRNTPLHGIGLQAHEPRLQWYPPQDVWDTLEKLSELDLPMHITEFHPHSRGAEIEGGFIEGKWTEITQAQYAEQMLKLAFGHPGVVSFSWWDFSENDSFIKGSALLNEDLSPKPVYETLDRLINHTWKTRESLQTDENGKLSLRGFYGDYRIRVTSSNGLEQVFEFSHTRESTSPIVFRLN